MKRRDRISGDKAVYCDIFEEVDDDPTLIPVGLRRAVFLNLLAAGHYWSVSRLPPVRELLYYIAGLLTILSF